MKQAADAAAAEADADDDDNDKGRAYVRLNHVHVDTVDKDTLLRPRCIAYDIFCKSVILVCDWCG